MRFFCASKPLVEEVSPPPPPADILPGLPPDLSLSILARVARGALPALRAVCRTWRQLADSSEFHSLRRQLLTSEEWVYLVGETPGYPNPQLLALDPLAVRYYHLGPLPPLHLHRSSDRRRSPLPSSSSSSSSSTSSKGLFQRQAFGLVALEGELLIIGPPPVTQNESIFGRRPGRGGGVGGGGGGGGVWRYNISRSQWRRCADMMVSREGFACGAIAGKVYVAGGRDKQGVALTSGEVYDPATDTWEALPPMGSAKHIRTGAVLNGRLHVLGCGDQFRCQPQHLLQPVRMEVFDPEAATWTTLKTDCPAPKFWGVPWHDQAVPVAGGGRMLWVGCGALKLRFYDAAANAFVGYFENELCAFHCQSSSQTSLAGFLRGPPGAALQARESCGLAWAGGRLLVVGGCAVDEAEAGRAPRLPRDVHAHTPGGLGPGDGEMDGEGQWKALKLADGPLVGKVWRCVTVEL